MEHAVALYVLNAAWQTPLVAIGAIVVTRAGLAARWRHRVMLLALLAAVLAPAIPAARALIVARPPIARAAPLAAQAATPSLPQPARSDPAEKAPPRPLQLSVGEVRVLTLAFCLAVALGGGRLAFAALAADALVRRSRSLALAADVAGALRRAAAKAGREAPEVRASGALASPVVVGARRPVIIVPERFRTLRTDEQCAALLHEFAHVRRGDYALNMMVEALSLPICWHPFTHLIKARASLSRELACDEAAAAGMACGLTYAKCLLALASALGPRAAPAATSVGLIGKSDLEERLMHILNPAPYAGAKRRLLTAAAAGALLAPVLLLRVTPAFAEPTAPASGILGEPFLAAAAAHTAVPILALGGSAAAPAHRSVGRSLQLADASDAEADHPQAPSSPAAPAPPAPAAEGAQAAQAAAAARVAAAAAHAAAGEAHTQDDIRRAVDLALEGSAEARKALASAEVERALAQAEAQHALASAEVQRALAEVRAHTAELTAAQQAEIQGRVRHEVEAAMAEVRRRLNSDEFRRAMRDAAKAAADARVEDSPSH